MKKFLVWSAGILTLVLVVGGLAVAKYFGAILVDYDETPPRLPEQLERPSVLVFSKAAGFVHVDALPAASKLLTNIAADNNWNIFETENGAVMSPQILARFDVVVWNNTSGTTLNQAQRAAFRDYMEMGGGFVGIHAAGGDFWYDWKWYVDSLLGAQFIGHTMDPHFQDAQVLVEQPQHPLVSHIPPTWEVPQEEWYGFDSNVADKGFEVLLSLDENSYDPNNSGMSGQHPITWLDSRGPGRAFYTAIGHQGATYDNPEFQTMLAKAIAWAGRLTLAEQ